MTPRLPILLLCCAASLASWAAEPFPVPLKNASFEVWVTAENRPSDWSLYGGKGANQKVVQVRPAFSRTGAALLLDDNDADEELGITRSFSVKEGLAYEVAVKVALPAPKARCDNAFLQLRFSPSDTFKQISLRTKLFDAFEEKTLKGMVPKGDTRAVIYLYTHRGLNKRVIIDDVRVTGGVPPPPPPPPPPPEMKAPQVSVLKDLHLRTTLVSAGKPSARIVTPKSLRAQAKTIQTIVRKITGTTLPIVGDDAPEAAIPLAENLILLGNRSTNRTLRALYNDYFTLLDLKYPGSGGHVVRTLHNPYANGCNAVLVGGSDSAGVATATAVLAKILRGAGGGKGTLELGWLLDTKLGKGLTVPDKIQDVAIWAASDGYGSTGYFGWNSISKHMALYYMTGNAFHAREFLRLAFPDAKAKQDISDIDGERIENKDDPLAGPYHYNQHMIPLYWDLIEESPIFTDEQRLRVTNAIARQLDHPDWARKNVYRLRGPGSAVSSRHGQWAAMGMLCLGRYFNRSYPNPVWQHCLDSGQWAFASLHEHAWVQGESDNLYWYSTGTAPILFYLCFTGDPKPIENGVLDELLRGQEILLSGVRGERHLHYASLGFLNRATYLTGDGRWVAYRNRLSSRTDILRVGQSFWPEPEVKPTLPVDLCGKWSVQALPEPAWRSRNAGIPLDQSFYFAGFRSRPDATGDYVLLDGYNGASRNPYHTFDILNLRIGGKTLLKGYQNQVLTKADGMVEPTVAMNAALLSRGVVGRTVHATGEVPRASFANWRRHLLLRTDAYAVVVDALTYRADSQNMSVNTLWETKGGVWDEKHRRANVRGSGVGPAAPAGWLSFSAMTANCTVTPDEARLIKPLESIGIMLLRARQPGPKLTMPFTLKSRITGNLHLNVVRYTDRGIVRVLLDGRELADRLDLHADGAVNDRIALGRQTLAPGVHKLEIVAVAPHPGGELCYAGISGISIKPLDGAKHETKEPVFQLATSDAVRASGSGLIRMQWVGAVKKNQRGIFFHTLAPSAADSADPCTRIADNAASMLLPQLAVGVVGVFEEVAADIAILASDHLFAQAMTHARIVTASAPVDIDWDFSSGDLTIVCTVPTALELASADSAVRLPVGTHTLRGRKPTVAALQTLSVWIADCRKRGLAIRKSEVAKLKRSTGWPKRPVLKAVEAGVFDKAVKDMVIVPDAKGDPMVCAVGGSLAKLIRADGTTAAILQADGEVRVAHWWAEFKLVLLGCRDEKVIAFDRKGKRQWEFVSVMDPDVFRAAKTYWFKTAAGHEGVHGLQTGPFIDGKNQCAVGSACTLEILNGDGTLAHRQAVFWGPGKQFLMRPLKDGTTDLLIARWPNGSDTLSVVNSKTLKVRRGYYGVPRGTTMVGGWSAQNRTRILFEDMDGDGRKEFVSATNGRWNRTTIFSDSGAPLYNAQFGAAGNAGYRRFLRDLEVTDLDGDGKKETLTASWEGLLVALDCECKLLWSRRLASPPCSVRRINAPDAPARLAVGCDDGTVALLDAKGEVLQLTKVKGKPGRILPLRRSDALFAVGTSAGKLLLIKP
ncbi:MAG: hypothetical protein KAI66_12980 [Lentisphaeria bacterium]|nr:hypothetical protein [Lentisphaeria bacterium]